MTATQLKAPLKAPRRRGAAGSTRSLSAVLTTFIGLGAVLMLAPFAWLVVATTHSTSEIFSSPPALLPGGHFWENFSGLFTSLQFGSALRNSVVVSLVYTGLGLVVCSAAGYAFAKFTFRGRGVLFTVIIASLALPGQVTLVPLFKMMVELGWLNSYQGLILPNLALPFGIFLMRQSMQSVPDELIQAARMDGAGELRTFLQIVLPTMRPALAALSIFLFLAQWNDFVYPLIVQRTPEAYTLPVSLATLHGVQSTDYGQLLTGTLISVLPVLVLFLFLQRYFVAGLLAGSVKQ
ncbi:carbohydrate ABC transporter permease [Streptomyces sp. cg28]|uniref:carbohydrate ABC transporter permease n=1 Tax=Streptomyces sp. cg28 TaxID=3403457 RepID=UPI003B20CA08